jgi:hypothetical protein
MVTVLRKCPNCRELVGGESAVCPRCGANFRSALIRRIFLRLLALGMLLWIILHFVLKRL